MKGPGERAVVRVAEDGTVGIPPSWLARKGWTEGTVLACDVQDDGSVLIRRARSDEIEPGGKESGA